MKPTIITDVSKTLVKMERAGDKGRFDPYDDVLAQVSHEVFDDTVRLNMKMATDGRVFPDHIATVVENAYKEGRPVVAREYAGLTPRELGKRIIDEWMRPYLSKAFAEQPVKAMEGLEEFLRRCETPAGGIITGDLRVVAYQLMTNNTFGDLCAQFPEAYWTCGDDAGAESRVDQLRMTHTKLELTAEKPIIFIDDAYRGVLAMRKFVQEAALRHTTIYGVLTGNSTPEQLKEHGADIVVPNIGYVRPQH